MLKCFKNVFFLEIEENSGEHKNYVICVVYIFMLSVGIMSIDIRAILKKILLIYYMKFDWLLVVKWDSIHTFVTICTSPSWQTYTLISITFVYALFSVNARFFVTWPLCEK